MSVTDTAWLAGLLEGDGSPYLLRGRPAVGLILTQEDVLNDAATIMGGTPRYRGLPVAANRKPTWETRLIGWPAVDVWLAVRPLMGSRRKEQIDRVIGSYSAPRRTRASDVARVRVTHAPEFECLDTGDQDAWLAGLLDAEGCFFLNPVYQVGCNPYPGVTVRMTDQDIIERAAGLMGVAVTSHEPQEKHYKPQWSCRVGGWPAIDVMERVRPLIGEEKGQTIDRLVGDYKASGAVRKTGRTHCKNGHEFTESNTYMFPNGARRCKTCFNAWQSARRKEVIHNGT